jgi:hypothetical protein
MDATAPAMSAHTFPKSVIRRKVASCFSLSTIWLLAAGNVSAQLVVTVSPVKAARQKAVIPRHEEQLWRDNRISQNRRVPD